MTAEYSGTVSENLAKDFVWLYNFSLVHPCDTLIDLHSRFIIHITSHLYIIASPYKTMPWLAPTPDKTQLNYEALALLQDALENFDDFYGAGSMSCAIYDTAWVSMVTKALDGEMQWLFPESFRVLLEEQDADGSWESLASQIDGILNTAAGLLSLIRHAKQPLQIAISGEDLQGRIERATTALQRQLDAWDVSLTLHVGYEIILPSMLKLISSEGVEIGPWRGEAELMAVNAAKMSRFKPEYLYGKMQLTALHSLESFVGLIDFDKVAHHKFHGAIMSSPSATAAFLMNLSTWDDEAEQYLRDVVARGPGSGRGSVPSAFPSTNFEYTWVGNHSPPCHLLASVC